VVTAFSHVDAGQWWHCRCDCGNPKLLKTSRLTCDRVKSCGCLRREKFIQRVTKHGGHGTRTYRIWCGIKKRCYEPRAAMYSWYGAKGITVCDRWLEANGAGYRNFLADMGERPLDKSLDRIDNNKGYGPENCRWASRREQSRNTSRTRMYTYNGKTMCLTDWMREITGRKMDGG
jgi:hypothetical protein